MSIKAAVSRISIFMTLCIALSFCVSCAQSINVDDGGDQTLGAPTLVTATGSNGQVDLAWTNAPGAVSYTVYYMKDSTTVSTTLYTDKKDPILTNSATIDSLDNGWTYAFLVVAVGTGGVKSSASNIMTAATGGSVVMPILSILTGTYTGDQTLTATCSTTNAVITYTAGSAPADPTRASIPFPTSGGLTVSASETVKIMAYVPSWHESTDSSVAHADYKIIDLYLLGTMGSSAATTWLNGTTTQLSGTGAVAKAMLVVGSDLYVVGYYFSGFNKACYWKNGTRHDLFITIPTSDSRGNAIAVDGSTVYVAGMDESSHACYWKDTGTITKTNFAYTGISEANAIYLDGSNIYATGYDEYALTGTYHAADQRACYWLNTGATVWLGLTDYESYGYGIYYNGTYLMTTGYRMGEGFYSAVYWQGTAMTDLSSPGLSNAYKLFYSGGTLYTCGNYQGAFKNACYWTIVPGTPTVTNTDLFLTGASSNTEAKAIAAVGGDVFIGGKDVSGAGTFACYWINNAASKTLVIELSDIVGIHVVQK